jgi:segregation and condensation protein B
MENNDKIKLSARVEAILFKLNEPTSLKKLCELTHEGEAVVRRALEELKQELSGRGVELLESGSEYSLVTAKGASETIEKMVKDEIGKDLGKASLETLSIVLYKGPLSRREIDYIRGVNSTFILRSLMVRGLVDRIEGTGRGPQYRATSELLAHMGVSKIYELPEYESIRAEIDAVNNETNNTEQI